LCIVNCKLDSASGQDFGGRMLFSFEGANPFVIANGQLTIDNSKHRHRR
jgi:hypothetical protein